MAEEGVGDQLDDAFFRALFHSTLGGIAVADLPSFTIVDINENLLEIVGRTREEIVGVPYAWRAMTPAEFHELDERAIREVLEQGRSEPFEKEYVRPDGSRVPVRVSSAVVQGYPGKLIVFVTDITHEHAARERERTIQQRLEIAISAADQGVWDWNIETNAMVYSERAKRIYGFPVDQPVTFEMVHDATHPKDLEWTIPLLRRALDPAIRDRSSYEYRVVWPDGQERWVLAYGEPVFEGPPGAERAVRYAGTIQDITERKAAERHQEILVAELNHRVKNMLAIVQSLAFYTLRSAAVPEAVADTFAGRLKALSSAHDILTEQSWEGADLGDIAQAALSPLVPELAERVSISGESFRLRPQAAVNLAMAFHELGTNAAKYGALAADRGRIDLSWTVEAHSPARLVIRWKESDGPPIARPDRQGFGTRMLQRILGGELRGRVQVDFRPSGLSCSIEAPVEVLGS
jgi:PAS domain S-box-containing protein